MQFSGSETQIIDEKTGNELFFDSTDPTAEVQIQKASKKPQRLLETTAQLNAPFDAKHHSVSAIGKLTVAAQAFLWDEAPLSGKDVVECVDRLL